MGVQLPVEEAGERGLAPGHHYPLIVGIRVPEVERPGQVVAVLRHEQDAFDIFLPRVLGVELPADPTSQLP
eukprot:5183461-Pyramimonas_sp.AAC.1